MAGSRKRFYALCCMYLLILSYAVLSLGGMGVRLPL